MTAYSQVTYAADMENNAERWWEEFRSWIPELRDDPELQEYCRTLEVEGSVTLFDPNLIERFDRFVSNLPGWEDGPEHARTALTIVAE